METDKEEKVMETLPTKSQGSTIIGFLKKLSLKGLACIAAYFLGYFNFSIAWMTTPLILSAIRDQYKKEKRQRLQTAREAALTNEKAMIETRMLVDDLPSWVFFPDKERAEWVNNMLKKLWPNVNNYVRKTLFETVEPLVKNVLNDYKIKGFKFERENVHLGQVPPRITGIKVYGEETNRNEIVMDMDIVFASDLEVMFSLKGIKAKVSEFSLRGMLRVVFKPLISEIPLIGGVQVYFLRDPEIDYALGGVAGALEVPGLGKIVENIVLEQVRNFIVLPNKFCMPLVNSIPKKELVCPNTAGVLRVKLIKAKDLMQKDVAIIGKGKSDPYAILTVGATTYKTPTVPNTCKPEWNETYDFPIEVVHGQEFMMEFFDEDDRRDDEFLGRATVQTGAVADRGHIEGFWVDLEECDSGMAQVSLSWMPVTCNQTVVREIATTSPDDDNAKCIIHIYIDSCTDLNDVKNPAYKPNCLVQVTCAKDVRQTWPKANTNNPVYEQGFVMLVNSPNSDDIHMKVLDTGKQNKCIGTVSVNIWNVINEPGMEHHLQPWVLKGGSPGAKITMSISVRGLKLDSAPSSPVNKEQSPLVESPRKASLSSNAFDETVRGGSILLKVHQAAELEKKDLRGKSDPYVIISYENQENKTQVIKNTLEPQWNHEEVIKIKENGDNKINIRVMDKDKIGKDEPLGVTELDVRHISCVGEITQNWEKLRECKSGKILLSASFIPSKPLPTEATTPAALPKKEQLIEFDEPQPLTPSTPEMLTPSFKDDRADSSVDTTDTPKPFNTSEALTPAETLGYMQEVEFEDEALDSEDLVDLRPDDENGLRAAASDSPVLVSAYHGGLEQRPMFLHVTVHRAIELIDKDVAGKSDPYVVITYGSDKHKSATIKNELNPVFNFSQSFVLADGGAAANTLKIELFDKDDVGTDDYLGSVILDDRLADLLQAGDELREHWSDLAGVERGKICYSVWCTETQPDTTERMRQPSHNNIIAAAISPAVGLVTPDAELNPFGESDGLRHRDVCANGKLRLTILYDEHNEELKVFVHEATGLPGGDLPDPPDPYVKVYLMPGKKKKKKTDVVKDSGSPRFDEEFDFDLPFKKVQEHSLKFSVVDKKGVFAKSPILGVCEISLDNPGLTQGVADWFPLHHDDEDSD